MYVDRDGQLAFVIPFLVPAAEAIGAFIAGITATDVAAGAGIAIIMTLPGDTPGKANQATSAATAGAACQPGCNPCKTVTGKTVPTGTVSYRPLDTPSSSQHGIAGPHYNIYKANQIPASVGGGMACNCFWQPAGAVSPFNLPLGAIPIEDFQR
jgi:hypothetical protein